MPSHLVPIPMPSKSIREALNEALGGTSAAVRSLQGLSVLMNSPPLRALVAADRALPRGGVELRAVNLPRGE